MSEFKKRLTDPGKPKRADTIEQVRLIQAENERRLSVAAKPTPEEEVRPGPSERLAPRRGTRTRLGSPRPRETAREAQDDPPDPVLVCPGPTGGAARPSSKATHPAREGWREGLSPRPEGVSEGSPVPPR